MFDKNEQPDGSNEAKFHILNEKANNYDKEFICEYCCAALLKPSVRDQNINNDTADSKYPFNSALENDMQRDMNQLSNYDNLTASQPIFDTICKDKDNKTNLLILPSDNCNMSAHMIYDKSVSKEDNQFSVLILSKTDNPKISNMTSRTTICSKHKFNKTLDDSINQVS
ncbi:hypothetical protein GJ496_008876 [Pomphorhynchus laevis]|nr:hypothetical protein GJ496_008876 [Pomphorhynchus laevis]